MWGLSPPTPGFRSVLERALTHNPTAVAARPHRADALALVVLVVVALCAAATFRDYGLGWDDYTHSQYGDLLLALFSSGFTDRRAFSFVNLYMYGGGFDLSAALAAKVLPFGLFETRRLVGAAVGVGGLFVTWRLGRRLGGPIAGLTALLLLATCPLYYGEMFINAKDGPFAATMALALLGLVRAFEEYPQPNPPTVALLGAGMGLAIGSRVMGGFAVLEGLIPLLLLLHWRTKTFGFKNAAGEWGKFAAAFIPAVVFAYLLMGLVWPWAIVAPLNPFRAVEYFSNFFEKPWRELFDGQLIPVIDMPRRYLPTLLSVKLPELILALGLAGSVGTAAAMSTEKRSGAEGARASLAAVLLAVWLPILLTVAARPAMYNGIRHFTFILPPLAVVGGLAAVWIAQRLAQHGIAPLTAGALVVVLGLASPVVEMVRLHPYEYTHFNRMAGGAPGARPLFMLDYWGLSLTQAARDLRRVVDARHVRPSAGDWQVAVCGPHPPVNVALGPHYDTTWDPKGADFAITLGEFYCAKLDAPVLFEIKREGVVYARVYDLAGRSVSTLLSVPGID